jgi:hypothetical protein
MRPRGPVRALRCASWLFVIALAAPLIINTSASASCRGLQGTFLQLTEAQAVRPAHDWSRLVGDLRSIGISDLFLQWTAVERKAFFHTAALDALANTPLPNILDLAAHAGIRVWIGLSLDTRYWEEIKQGPDLLRAYFYRRVRELRGFVDDLNSMVSRAPFAGWYITDEIDDRTWLDPTKRALLKRYLADTVSLLKARRSGSKVAISGFSNSFADPDLLAAFWVDLLEGSGIDLLLFQDGVGEGKVAIEDIPLYYEPLNRAVSRTGGQLGAVVELFSLMPNGQRVPAMIARIREQIAAADRLTSFPPVAFSVPDYMSNLAGPEASGLLANFLATKRRCRG